MGNTPTARLNTCSAIVAGGAAVAAGCPVLAPLLAAGAAGGIFAAADGVAGRAAAAPFDRPDDWLQVFGELRRLGGQSAMPSHPAQAEAARRLNDEYVTRLRNVIKGDPSQSGSNRPFVALQLDFMRLL